jgi:hypothetical protein
VDVSALFLGPEFNPEMVSPIEDEAGIESKRSEKSPEAVRPFPAAAPARVGKALNGIALA